MLDTNSETPSLDMPAGSALPWLRQLNETGQPIVFTICGRVELAIQDAASFQMLLQLVDRLETLNGIQAGLEDMEAGRTVSLEQAGEELERGLPR